MDVPKDNILIIGKELIDSTAVDQLRRCVGPDDYGVLTADAHVGYAHPIGGAVAYREKISLSGVGFDIACGNLAVRTDIRAYELDIRKVMDEITQRISFGIGRVNDRKVDHPVIDKISQLPVKTSRSHRNLLFEKARTQLGTVGAGNHFVDLFQDEDGYLWIGVHFGSRGFGHGLTTGFIAVSQGLKFDDPVKEGNMFANPILFDAGSETGQDYLSCLQIAGDYAYAGREWVVNEILNILDKPEVNYSVHNHHNFAWREDHFGEKFWVVRKGCTPAFPGQAGFIGSNMFDRSVVIEGLDSEESKKALYSTVHGAGRVLSRRQALGKRKWVRNPSGKKVWKSIAQGLVDFQSTKNRAVNLGIVLIGGDADESPECYKNLEEVLAYHGNTVKVLFHLQPIGVAMAGEDVYDPYKD